MARYEDQSMLGANLPGDFVAEFWENAILMGGSKNAVIRAMAELWIDVPDDLKRDYLTKPPEQRSPLYSHFSGKSKINTAHSQQAEHMTQAGVEEDVDVYELKAELQALKTVVKNLSVEQAKLRAGRKKRKGAG
jgi:hypothetical protein